MEETPQVAEGLTDETPQTAEAQMDEASQTEEVLTAETLRAGEALTDEATQVSEIPMDEASQTAARRFSLRDAAPFALVILVTVAVIAFIVAAPSAHAETSTAQGNNYIQQTVEYVDRSATLYPAVCYAELTGIADTGEVCSWSQDVVGNAVDYEVTVKNSGFGGPACFRTVIALECGPNGEALTFLNANTKDFAWSKVDGAIEVAGVRYAVYVAVYEGSAGGSSQGQLASSSDVNVVSQVAMRSSVGNSQVATLGEDYNIMVITQAVAASPTADEDININLLDTAFGEITATNHPWIGSKGSDSSTAA